MNLRFVRFRIETAAVMLIAGNPKSFIFSFFYLGNKPTPKSAFAAKHYLKSPLFK